MRSSFQVSAPQDNLQSAARVDAVLEPQQRPSQAARQSPPVTIYRVWRRIEVMTSTAALIGAALAFPISKVDAFVPADRLVGGGASSHSLTQHGNTSGKGGCTHLSKGTWIPSASHTPSQGSSGAGPRLSSVVYGLSHGSDCSCGGCSVRRNARPQGYGGGRRSTTLAGFHGRSCGCRSCSPGKSKRSSSAIGRRVHRRKAAALTVVGTGGGGQAASDGATAGLRERLAVDPGSIMFEDVMAAIADGFDYTPRR